MATRIICEKVEHLPAVVKGSSRLLNFLMVLLPRSSLTVLFLPGGKVLLGGRR